MKKLFLIVLFVIFLALLALVAWWLPVGVVVILFGRKILRATLRETEKTYTPKISDSSPDDVAPAAVWLQVLRALVIVEILPFIAALALYAAFIDLRRDEVVANIRKLTAPQARKAERSGSAPRPTPTPVRSGVATPVEAQRKTIMERRPV